MAHNQKLLIDPNTDTGSTLSDKVNNQSDRILSNFLETSDGGPPDGIQPGGIWTRQTNTTPPIFEIMLRTSSGTQESERDVVLNRINTVTGDVASADVVNLAANSGVGSTEVSGILNTINGGTGMSVQNNATGHSQFRTQYGITSAIAASAQTITNAITSAYQSFITAAITTAIPAGTTTYFAGENIPNSWLLCDGRVVSRSTYAQLFAVIGTTYGSGDYSTTFNLPDGRGVFVRGLDDGRGLDPNRQLGSYQEDEFKSHKHGAGSDLIGTANQIISVRSNLQSDSNTFTDSTGGDETRPKNIAMNLIIKY